MVSLGRPLLDTGPATGMKPGGKKLERKMLGKKALRQLQDLRDKRKRLAAKLEKCVARIAKLRDL